MKKTNAKMKTKIKTETRKAEEKEVKGKKNRGNGLNGNDEISEFIKMLGVSSKAEVIKAELDDEKIKKLLALDYVQVVSCQKQNAQSIEKLLRVAYLEALLAFKNKTNIAKNIKNEILVRFSKEKNISEAIKKAGAKNGENLVLILDPRRKTEVMNLIKAD